MFDLTVVQKPLFWHRLSIDFGECTISVAASPDPWNNKLKQRLNVSSTDVCESPYKEMIFLRLIGFRGQKEGKGRKKDLTF